MLRKLLWTGLYGGLSALASAGARRGAFRIWRTATGEEPPTKKTSRGDQAMEWASQRLHRMSQAAAERGGPIAKLARPLEEDSLFVRKLKPSLIAKRSRGEPPTNEEPESAPVPPPAQVTRPPEPTTPSGGPSPWRLVGAAAAAGIVLAKLIDWRGHAHPRVAWVEVSPVTESVEHTRKKLRFGLRRRQ